MGAPATYTYTPPGFSQLDAPGLFNVATIANYPLSQSPPVQPWSLVNLIKGSSFGVQGFTAFGQMLCDPNTTVGLVVLGLQWPSFLNNYQSSFHTLASVPAGMLPSQIPPAQCDWGLSLFYGLVRPAMWKMVLQMKTYVQEFQTLMPIITVGYGPAAPLAQLAALDLLPGQTYAGMTSPATSVSCYAFSAAAFGDANFMRGFASAVPQGFVVNLATSGGAPVDLYPQVAGDTGMFVAGSPQGPAANIPIPTCPWLEREPCLYGAALNGTTCTASSSDAQVSSNAAEPKPLLVEATTPFESTAAFTAPAGFNKTTASNLSLLCSSVYQSFEHPSVPLNPPATYSLVQTLSADGAIWAAIFKSPQTLSVVFRGPVTWEETVNLWGGSDTSTPIWLPNPGNAQPLTSCEELYEQLGPAMRTALQQYGAGNAVYVAGHGGGGALAAMALWDLTATPISGVTLAGLYSFGGGPVGNQAFATGFATACGSLSYPIVRPLDVIPKLQLGAPFSIVPLSSPIQLDGGDTDPRNGFTYHSIVVYQSLLNTASLSAPVMVQSHPAYQAQLLSAGVPWNEVTKCPVNTAENGGKVVLSWNKDRSYVPATHYADDGSACIALQDVLVQPGDELHLHSTHGHTVQVVARSLQLGAGSVVHVGTNATLQLGELHAQAPAPGAALQDPPMFVITGPDGSAGPDGGSGWAGPSGGPRAPGANGSFGGSGGTGGSGYRATDLTVQVDRLSGTLRVAIRGGHGGHGGNGGNGGAGGNGGPVGGGQLALGGNGGNGGAGGTGGIGGDGGVVTVVFNTMDSGTQVILENLPAPGGPGGMGGAGAPGGAGSPPGQGGLAGPMGAPGAPGLVGKLILQQRGGGLQQVVQ